MTVIKVTPNRMRAPAGTGQAQARPEAVAAADGDGRAGLSAWRLIAQPVPMSQTAGAVSSQG